MVINQSRFDFWRSSSFQKRPWENRFCLRKTLISLSEIWFSRYLLKSTKSHVRLSLGTHTLRPLVSFAHSVQVLFCLGQMNKVPKWARSRDAVLKVNYHSLHELGQTSVLNLKHKRHIVQDMQTSGMRALTGGSACSGRGHAVCLPRFARVQELLVGKVITSSHHPTTRESRTLTVVQQNSVLQHMVIKLPWANVVYWLDRSTISISMWRSISSSFYKETPPKLLAECQSWI